MRQLLVLLLAACTTAFTPSVHAPSRGTAPKMMKLSDDTKAMMVSVALAVSAFGGVQSAVAADIAAGEQIFSYNCAACHAGGNNVIVSQKTLRLEALKEYLAGGESVKSVITQVTNGKNAMPAFGGRLSDDDIINVASYVIDQAEGGKWDGPGAETGATARRVTARALDARIEELTAELRRLEAQRSEL